MYFLTQTIVVLRWFPPALYVYHNCGIVVSQDIISASSVKVTVSILEIVILTKLGYYLCKVQSIQEWQQGQIT